MQNSKENVLLEKTLRKKNIKLSPELRAFLNKNQEDDFVEEGTTEITECNVWRCSVYHPCKRTSCFGCQERRRKYFVDMGTVLAKKKELNKHATITWSLQHGDSPWEKLLSLSSMLSKYLTGRIGPFMRALALGKLNTPHVHFLINSEYEKWFYKFAKENSPDSSRIFVDIDEAYDVPQLLNYFFVCNFNPTVNDPRRPKGIRLLSGSRDPNFTYSYPKTKHWKHYAELMAQDERIT